MDLEKEAIERIKSKIRILEKLENYGSAIEERKKKHIGLYNTAMKHWKSSCRRNLTLKEMDTLLLEHLCMTRGYVRVVRDTNEIDYHDYVYCPKCDRNFWSE